MKKISLFIAILGLASCGTHLYTPTETKSSVPLDNLVKGKDLYVNNCASCHELYNPSRFSPKRWTSILEEMQPKAKITNEQKDLIYAYLTNEPKK